MVRLTHALLLSLLGTAPARLSEKAESPSCPPADFSSVQNFDLDAFSKGRWHIQQQMAVFYLAASQNRCVYAEYSLKPKKSFWGYDVSVHNHAEDVAAPHKVHDSGSFICAKIVDKSAGQLEVAPCFLPSFTAGPYWVIAFDDKEGYALISGGKPTKSAPGGCRTGTGVNDSGLWIFTRQQKRDEALVQKVRGIAASKGFDLSVLNDVDQTNCGSEVVTGLTASRAAPTCPPAGFASVQNFDLDAFIKSRWHIQQQMPVSYLPASQNRCVYAEYSLKASRSLLGYDVNVHNHAEDVAPPHAVHDSGSKICARIVDKSTGKLEVAPCFLPSFLAGPYWVIAFDDSEGYALISGGPPTKSAPNGCQTGTGTNDSGLWIFTRQQKRDDALVAKVRGIAASKGFDLSVLNDVDQTDCGSEVVV